MTKLLTRKSISNALCEDKIDLHVLMQVLATMDVSDLQLRTLFYDELGYDMIPMQMSGVHSSLDDETLLLMEVEITLNDNLSSMSDGGYLSEEGAAACLQTTNLMMGLSLKKILKK